MVYQEQQLIKPAVEVLENPASLFADEEKKVRKKDRKGR
jgi:hypothetical protein